MADHGRLIDADALIVALKRKVPISDAMRVMWVECLEEVRHAPTIEPERKKGKWIECEDNTSFVKQLPRRWIECSECEASYAPGYKSRYLFCPNCGADMREGVEQDG